MRILGKFLSFSHLQLTLLITFIVFVSYGQTLQMYFWQDDSALIFKLQNPEGAAGSFGTGIIGQGAYKYLVTPFVPFFPIFGLEPFGYFFIGLLAYILIAGVFYLFSTELFRGKKAGLFATLIFAAGYIGSDIMFRIINSWQANIGLVLALLTLWMYTKHLHEGGLGKYLLSVGLFVATIEFAFIRSHSLILPILVVDILIRVIPPTLNKLPKLMMRQLPFWFLWQKSYLADPEFGGPGLRKLFESISQGEFIVLSPLFANIGNAIIPDVLQTKLIGFLGLGVVNLGILLTVVSIGFIWVLGSKFQASIIVKLAGTGFLILGFLINYSFYLSSPLWYRDIQSVTAGLIGIQTAILVFFSAWFLWSKNNNFSVVLSFAFIFLASQIFGYYTQYPTAIFSTTHRYFYYSFVGYGLIFGGIAFLLSRSRFLGILPLLLLLATNLFLSVRYQAKFVEERSLPTRKFYKDLKTYVPSIEKGAVFYFDIISEPFYQHQFGNFFSVGSMPESTALAIYYDVDRYDLSMLTNFDELLFRLSEDEADIDSTYTFFYGPEGLVNTTEKTRELLRNGSMTTEAQKASALTPLLLKVEMSVSPATLPELPYSYGNGGKNYSLEEKLQMLSYLKGRKNYYSQVQASSLSEWKFREVRNVVDNDSSTVWQGHRIRWHEDSYEQLTVDLGGVKRVGRVVWQNWTPALTPTSYKIETSLDNILWSTVKETKDSQEHAGGEVAIDNFESVDARFVRMDIMETLTGDSPAVLEFEVVENKYRKINPQEALEFIKHPFAYVVDQREWSALYSALDGLAEATVSWETDKKSIYSSTALVPIVLDGKMHSYEIMVPAGGTRLGEVKVNFNFPSQVNLGRITARNLSLEELKTRGLIVEFKEN